MQWLPLLQPIVVRAHKQEERKATISLQLLATIIEVGGDHVFPHILNVATLAQGEISKHIPSHLEPQPQVLKHFPYLTKAISGRLLCFYLPQIVHHVLNKWLNLGFVAVALLTQTWDGIEPDEDKDDGKALANWKFGCAIVANTFYELVQQALLMLARSINELLQHFVKKTFICEKVK